MGIFLPVLPQPRRLVALAILALAFATSTGVAAQTGLTSTDPLSRIVTVAGPIGFDAAGLLRLSEDTDVPVGFERAGATEQAQLSNDDAFGRRNPRGLAVKGRPLREALDAMMASDPRYVWHEMDGVVVVRPASNWGAEDHALSVSVPPGHFEEVTRVELRLLLTQLLGRPRLPLPETTLFNRETLRYTVDTPRGRLLDVLNAVIKPTGGFWMLSVRQLSAQQGESEPSRLIDRVTPALWLGLGEGSIGSLIDVADIAPTAEPLMAKGHVPGFSGEVLWDNGRLVELPPPADPLDWRLEGHEHSSVTVGVLSLMAVRTGLPFGFEEVGAMEVRRERRAPDSQIRVPRPQPGADTRGLTVREALDAMVAADPRYSWRQMDGVVVVRPVQAWASTSHTLNRPAGPVVLENATLGHGMAAIAAALGQSSDPRSYSDRRRFSLNFNGGTILDFANAVAFARGTAVWSVVSSDGPPDDMRDVETTSVWRPVLHWLTPAAAADSSRYSTLLLRR